MRATAATGFLLLIGFVISGIVQTAAIAAAPALTSPQPEQSSYTSAGFPFLGRHDSPVTMVEFSDFQCPFCRRFFTSTFPELKREYIDTGKMRYVFIDFPLEQIHPLARQAAEAAHCAGDQGKFWQMHDALFSGIAGLELAQLMAYARALGVEEQAFEACLRSGKQSARIDRALGSGASAGVKGTPTFLIAKSRAGDTLLWSTSIEGAQPIERFRKAIEEVLAEP